MISLLQCQAAYVPDEYVPSLLRHPYRLLQYLQKIIRARKILHDGIHDNQIYTVVAKERKLMRHPFPQLHMTEVRAGRQIALQLPQYLWREIDSDKALAICCQARQQKTCPAANLQNPPRMQSPQLRHGLLDPDPHLLDRNHLPAIAALPAG